MTYVHKLVKRRAIITLCLALLMSALSAFMTVILQISIPADGRIDIDITIITTVKYGYGIVSALFGIIVLLMLYALRANKRSFENEQYPPIFLRQFLSVH